MTKRKAERNIVEKYTKTPDKNVEAADPFIGFSDGEDPMKGANRNSKRGKQGK